LLLDFCFSTAAPSPTNSAGLHIIQEEHQQNPILLPNYQYINQNKSVSSSSEALKNVDGDENEMDCDVHHHHPEQPLLFHPPYYHHPPPSLFYCNTSPLLAQHLAIPTTTSSYMP
jgi:hypothetical protein